MTNAELYEMIADHMTKGLLENIKDMFRHDHSLFEMLPSMIIDERMGVRIGFIALVEDMRGEYMPQLIPLIPAIAAHLSNEHPTFRGDAVYMLSAIGHPDALPYLESHHDDHPGVIEMVADTIEELTHSKK